MMPVLVGEILAAMGISVIEDAAAAATAAGVRIRLAVDLAELQRIERFFATIWETSPAQPPLAVDVLRAITHADGAVHWADDGTGVAGAAALIHCAPASRAVYSLLAAAGASDRGVGFAVKLAQRAWALDQGVTTMTWTFDPLVSRNARFNLVKLGAVAASYAVNHYGPLNDGREGDDETDRLIASWPMAGERAAAAAAGRPAECPGPDPATAEPDPRRAPDGGPLAARHGGSLWCRVPADIVALRRRDPALAGEWRTAVRDVLRPALAEGLVATGFSRSGWYQLTRPEQP
jgi:predicted GNAT superfamily acetyltransferase